MMLSNSDWIALFALVVAGGALALEVRRWFESGPRLHLSVLPDGLDIGRPGGKPFVGLIVTNRGDAPTILTGKCFKAYRSRLHKLLRKRPYVGAVFPYAPETIGVNEYENIEISYIDEMIDARANHALYVGVFASHSIKPCMIRVPPKRKEDPSEMESIGEG